MWQTEVAQRFEAVLPNNARDLLCQSLSEAITEDLEAVTSCFPCDDALREVSGACGFFALSVCWFVVI